MMTFLKNFYLKVFICLTWSIIFIQSSPIRPTSSVPNSGKPKELFGKMKSGISKKIDKTIQRLDSHADRQHSRNKAANEILKLSDDILNTQKYYDRKTFSWKPDPKPTKEYKKMQNKYIVKGVYQRGKTSIADKASSILKKVTGRPPREFR